MGVGSTDILHHAGARSSHISWREERVDLSFQIPRATTHRLWRAVMGNVSFQIKSLYDRIWLNELM